MKRISQSNLSLTLIVLFVTTNIPFIFANNTISNIKQCIMNGLSEYVKNVFWMNLYTTFAQEMLMRVLGLLLLNKRSQNIQKYNSLLNKIEEKESNKIREESNHQLLDKIDKLNEELISLVADKDNPLSNKINEKREELRRAEEELQGIDFDKNLSWFTRLDAKNLASKRVDVLKSELNDLWKEYNLYTQTFNMLFNEMKRHIMSLSNKTEKQKKRFSDVVISPEETHKEIHKSKKESKKEIEKLEEEIQKLKEEKKKLEYEIRIDNAILDINYLALKFCPIFVPLIIPFLPSYSSILTIAPICIISVSVGIFGIVAPRMIGSIDMNKATQSSPVLALVMKL